VNRSDAVLTVALLVWVGYVLVVVVRAIG